MGDSGQIAGQLKKGDRVRWSAGRKQAQGLVERVITRRTKLGGRTVVGSQSDPRYVVRDESSGTRAIRSGDSLRSVQTAPSLPPWPAVVGAVAFVLLAAFAAVYFTQVPDRLAEDYRDDAGPAFERVDESVYDSLETFRTDYFRGLAIKEFNEKRTGRSLSRLRRVIRRQYATDRGDIEAARRAIADAEETLSANEDALTEVDAPPLLGGIGGLADARDTASEAESYIEANRRFFDQYRELIDYAERTLNLDEDINETLLDEAQTAPQSFEAAKAGVDRAVKTLKGTRSKIEAMQPPTPDGDPFFFGTERGAGILIAFYEQIQAAYAQLDEGKLDDALDGLERDFNRFGVKVVTKFDELQRESEINSSIDEIEEAEEKLGEDLDVESGPHSDPPPLVLPEKEESSEV